MLEAVNIVSSNFCCSSYDVFLHLRVRKADKEAVDMLPKSVEIVTGDVGDPATLFSTEKESQGNRPTYIGFLQHLYLQVNV